MTRGGIEPTTTRLKALYRKPFDYLARITNYRRKHIDKILPNFVLCDNNTVYNKVTKIKISKKEHL